MRSLGVFLLNLALTRRAILLNILSHWQLQAEQVWDCILSSETYVCRSQPTLVNLYLRTRALPCDSVP